MAIVFDGRKFAKNKERELKKEVSGLKEKGITPKLISVLVGDNPASILYVSLKKKAAERIGAEVEIIRLSQSSSPRQVSETIEQCNNDGNVHGIMVQLPLPRGLGNSSREASYSSQILNSIAPEKDVDGLRQNSGFVQATVKGILQIIKQAISDKRQVIRRVVVVGSEGMVGKPLVKILRTLGYNVVGYDIDTKNLSTKTQKADLLISATGKPGIIKGDMVSTGAAVIDVGSPKGDVEFDEAVKKASFITPVPGGVGPVTIVSLLENLLIATKERV